MNQPLRESLSGGCIAAVERWSWSDGRSVIRKTYRNPAIAKAEALGLQTLAQHARQDGAAPVPAVLSVDRGVLELSDLGMGQGRPSEAAWGTFAQRLASLHRCPGPAFGFEITTYCGATAQPNAWCDDGYAFVAQQRLGDLAQRCRAASLIDGAFHRELEHIAQRLPQLVPAQEPVLVHGDLWSGNVHYAADGDLYLIDPACWYGWAESDLALADLFGGFPPVFWQRYEDEGNLNRGWRQRLGLHQIWHLLNHALLFGGHYAQQAAQAARPWQ